MSDSFSKRRTVSRFIRLLFASHVLIALSGCGAAIEKIEPPARKAITIEGVIPVLYVSRLTPGFVQISLWVDAGSRDASPPQVATVAAWIAADRAHSDLQVYVVPDGIEFSTICRSLEIDKCITWLGSALNARNPTQSEMRKARMRLVESRLRALSQDRARSSDRLALKALLGTDADSLFPLGERKADDRVTKTAVGDFLKAHFGPARALLVAVGEVQTSDLREAVQAAFSNNSKAHADRAQRTIRAFTEGVEVEIGAINAVTISAITPDLASAVAIGRALHISLKSERFANPAEPTTHAFQLRGGALLTIRLTEVRDPIKVVQYATSEFFRLRIEGVDETPIISGAESAREEARAVGTRWCSQDEQPAEDHYALGIGVVVEGGRADRPRVGTPDAKRRKKLQITAVRALNRGRRAAHSKLVGNLGEDTATVTATNGARIAVERRVADKVAVSVHFASGAQRDPPTLHGRAALLATLASTSCRGYPTDLLAARLEEMEATLEPLVESDYWGVVLVAPKKWWHQAIDICTTCALKPSFERRDLATARLRLLEKFGKTSTPFDFTSQAALLIAPASPGSVAPRGSRDSLANISLGELTDLFNESAKGEALTIAAVGDLPVVDATRRIARRVVLLPRGSVPRYEPPLDSKTTLLASWSSDSQTRAIVAWRAEGLSNGRPGATAFVLQMRNFLANMPGIDPVWYDAAAQDWGTWAAIAIEVSQEALPTLEQSVRQATRMISFKHLSKLVDATVERDSIVSQVQAAQLKYAVERIARKSRNKPVESLSRKAALEVARALRASAPRFAIFRPRTK